MTERPNLFAFFLLAAVAISSIISGIDSRPWEYIQYYGEHPCDSAGVFPGRRCKPHCVAFDPRQRICFPFCVCEDGRLECDVRRNTCSCLEHGWKGDNCTEPCDNNYYGRNCKNKCKCKHSVNATCDRFTGGCTCTAGYQGPLCEDKCPTGSHGFECSNVCKCQNGAMCHHVDGSCECTTAGWMGEVCAEPCLEGTYGINCSETCDCFKNAPCNVTTGDCVYTKDMFECNFNVNASSEPNNLNDSQPHSSTSDTNNSCLPGFSGKNCENRACPANKWGQTCSNECKCRNGSYCHPLTGGCWCELGWTGEDCSVSLNEAHFEEHIMEEGYSSSHSSLIVTAICVPMVAIILIIIASLVYYKKRPFWNGDNLILPSYSELDDKEDL